MTRPLDIFRSMLLAAFQAYLLSAAVKISRTALNKWSWLLQGSSVGSTCPRYISWGEHLPCTQPPGFAVLRVQPFILVFVFLGVFFKVRPILHTNCVLQTSDVFICLLSLLCSGHRTLPLYANVLQPSRFWTQPVLSYFPRVSIICPHLQYLLNLTVLDLSDQLTNPWLLCVIVRIIIVFKELIVEALVLLVRRWR